jgi:hypothetical protein
MDVQLLAALPQRGLLDGAGLRAHLQLTPLREAMIVKAHHRLDQVLAAAGDGEPPQGQRPRRPPPR